MFDDVIAISGPRLSSFLAFIDRYDTIVMYFSKYFEIGKYVLVQW